MSRWLRNATNNAMNTELYNLVENYKDVPSYDIPENDKAIIMSNPLACAQYAVYYEKKHNKTLPYEWYECIRKSPEASDWYVSNNLSSSGINSNLYDLEISESANPLAD